MKVNATIVVGLLAVLVVVGCESQPKEVPVYMSNTQGGANEQTLLNMARLQSAPAPVRGAFLTDYPDAAVLSVEQETSSTGRLIWRVGYLDLNGQPQAVRYYSDGETMGRGGR